MKKTLLALILLVGTAAADPFMGTVYGLYPEGLMLDSGNGAMLIPVQNATFQVGGVRLDYTQLVPGQAVQVMVPPPYIPQIVQVPDPYAWHCKHHPHGGPPGQMKKMYGKGKGKGKGH